MELHVRDMAEQRAGAKEEFAWTVFYMAIADKLLTFRKRRGELIEGIHKIASDVDCLSILQDKLADGTSVPLQDICPFTTIGIFNRGITSANRRLLAGRLARLLGVSEEVPHNFDGIPLLNNQRSWFFAYSRERGEDDIDVLWDVFAKAIALADSGEEAARADFCAAYDEAISRPYVRWNLSIGLYWTRPWFFPPLDSPSRNYVEKYCGIHIEYPSSGCCNAEKYLEVRNKLAEQFHKPDSSINSFPALSFAAYAGEQAIPTRKAAPEVPDMQPAVSAVSAADASGSYDVERILKEGGFVPREKLEMMLARWRNKKNLILQGPPGTGKTWLARRLAYALMGERDDGRLRAVQFHPNLSYEDFIRGWRPAGEGRLTLCDGPFLEMADMAGKSLDKVYVVLIEEINRGNPAQIFGEMLTLLEADKRTPDAALELAYRNAEGERVYLPPNLYIIGTMNIADRSLALVDLALRRRFTFMELEPVFSDAWRGWVHAHCGVPKDELERIGQKLKTLNDTIALEAGLGPQYRVGHSYVTPPADSKIENAGEWFRQIVATEIGPLLDEYWFDAPDKAYKAKKLLLEGY